MSNKSNAKSIVVVNVIYRSWGAKVNETPASAGRASSLFARFGAPSAAVAYYGVKIALLLIFMH